MRPSAGLCTVRISRYGSATSWPRQEERTAGHRRIALAVAERRSLFDLTQDEAAERCDLMPETYRAVEDLKGSSRHRIKTLEKLARGLRFKLAELMLLQDTDAEVVLSPPEPLTAEQLELDEHVRVVRRLTIENRRSVYGVARSLLVAQPA